MFWLIVGINGYVLAWIMWYQWQRTMKYWRETIALVKLANLNAQLINEIKKYEEERRRN